MPFGGVIVDRNFVRVGVCPELESDLPNRGCACRKDSSAQRHNSKKTGGTGWNGKDESPDSDSTVLGHGFAASTAACSTTPSHCSLADGQTAAQPKWSKRRTNGCSSRPTTLQLGRRDPSVERRAAPRATRLPSAEVVVDLVVAAVMVGTYTHAHFIDPGHRSAPRSRERSGGGGQVLKRHCERLITCRGTTSCFTRIAVSTLLTALHAAASSRRRGGGACGGGGDDSGGGDDGDLDREGGGNSGDDAHDEYYCGSSGGLKPDSLPFGVFDGDAYARSCAFTTLLVTAAAGFVVRAGCFDPLACLLASHVHVRGRAPAVEGRRHVRGWTRTQIPLSLFRPAVTPRHGRRTSSPPLHMLRYGACVPWRSIGYASAGRVGGRGVGSRGRRRRRGRRIRWPPRRRPHGGRRRPRRRSWARLCFARRLVRVRHAAARRPRDRDANH